MKIGPFTLSIAPILAGVVGHAQQQIGRLCSVRPNRERAV